MADEQQDKDGSIDMAAVADAVEGKPEQQDVAVERVAEAVEADPAPPVRPKAAKRPAKRPAAKAPSIKSKAPVAADQNITMTKDNIVTEETINTATGNANPMGDYAAKMQDYYQRSSTMLSEMADLGRGNVEAVVESSRVLATGLQDIGRTTLEGSRTAMEGATADMKRMAAVKSPTKLMQLQSELARRNMDAVITQTSKNTEAMLKLANDVFAPLSNRMSVAAEKLAA